MWLLEILAACLHLLFDPLIWLIADDDTPVLVRLGIVLAIIALFCTIWLAR